jgi:hypothetical protein
MYITTSYSFTHSYYRNNFVRRFGLCFCGILVVAMNFVRGFDLCFCGILVVAVNFVRGFGLCFCGILVVAINFVRGFGLCFCGILVGAINLVLLLSSYVSELQKASHRASDPGQIFRDCGLRSCNFLSKVINFGLCAVLQSFLVSELQDPPSPMLDLRLFSEF